MIDYYLLTKPGIVLGNLITVVAGFFLASRGVINFPLLLATFIGIGLIMASACVFNNLIDRDLDKKMERTKQRALARGTISGTQAILFGGILGISGGLVLYAYTNLLTVLIASIGFFTYVVLYTLYKCRTVHGTAIGSIAGAVPPLIGYCAVSNQFDIGALILFAMLVLWQMPHFFSITLLHLNDYLKTGMPLLPIQKGIPTAKMHMFLYIIAFIMTAALLTWFEYTGYTYLAVTSLISLLWLLLSFKGFESKNDQVWGKQMFRLSLVTIMITCFMIFVDTL